MEKEKLELRERFFAQYWGTKTLYVGGVGLQEVGKGGWNLKHPDFFLELKPLSEITDGDAMSMYRGLGVNYASARQFLDDYYAILFLAQHEADYLRSKGYLVPFSQYSTEDLLSFGWVKYPAKNS